MNYGIGGSVRQHVDAVTARTPQDFLLNQNMVTVLLYLSDDVEGEEG